MDSLEEIKKRIQEFNDERDWNQFHSPENLAKSISFEANELLECFQWSNDFCRENVIEELADVTNYCIQMSQVLNIDLIKALNEKMDKTEKKYPVEKTRGKSTKYTDL